MREIGIVRRFPLKRLDQTQRVPIHRQGLRIQVFVQQHLGGPAVRERKCAHQALIRRIRRRQRLQTGDRAAQVLQSFGRSAADLEQFVAVVCLAGSQERLVAPVGEIGSREQLAVGDRSQ